MGTLQHNPQIETHRPLTKTGRGQESVARVADVLTRRRYRVKSHLPYNCPFDLLCNGKRVEVKTANLRKGSEENDIWTVNIHRHGEVDESMVDVYAVELCAEFLERPVLLLYAAPVGVTTLQFTPHGLMRGKYANAVENWALLEPVAKNPTLTQIFAGYYENTGEVSL